MFLFYRLFAISSSNQFFVQPDLSFQSSTLIIQYCVKNQWWKELIHVIVDAIIVEIFEIDKWRIRKMC